jgi:hypothetical protein
MALGLGCRATKVIRPGLIMYMTEIEVFRRNETRRNASTCSRAVLCKIDNTM